MAVAYILLSALVIYNVEPESFATFFDAVYWATISLTTVGYGDIYPITVLGRVFGALIALLGIGMVAIPTGIISSGLVDYLNSQKKDDVPEETKEELEFSFCPHCGKKIK